MSMEKISVDKAREIAENKDLQPAIVKGTDGIQFTKGNNPRLKEIDWDDFREKLDDRGLAVYESGGWMKIMKE